MTLAGDDNNIWSGNFKLYGPSHPDKGICGNKLEASFICFFVQDDEDLDLFGDETEEEKAAAEEREAAKKAAAGAKKKESE